MNWTKRIHHREETRAGKEIIVHGAMAYRCNKCGKMRWMFLEKGLEEGGKDHKPVPFGITCKCGGSAFDVSGLYKFPGEKYRTLPEGASYFKNKKDHDCGVPVLAEPMNYIKELPNESSKNHEIHM